MNLKDPPSEYRKKITSAALIVAAPLVGFVVHCFIGPFIGNESPQLALSVGSLGWSLLGALLILLGKFSKRKLTLVVLLFPVPATLTIVFGVVIILSLQILRHPALGPIMGPN